VKNGSIILMHNGTENTANSLEFIITNVICPLSTWQGAYKKCSFY